MPRDKRPHYVAQVTTFLQITHISYVRDCRLMFYTIASEWMYQAYHFQMYHIVAVTILVKEQIVRYCLFLFPSFFPRYALWNEWRVMIQRVLASLCQACLPWFFSSSIFPTKAERDSLPRVYLADDRALGCRLWGPHSSDTTWSHFAWHIHSSKYL